MSLPTPSRVASSHYRSYLLSKLDYDGSFDDPHGFILFKQVSPTEMRIGEIFVEPSKRSLGIGRELADRVLELAISKGCTHLSCSNNLTNPVEDRMAQLAILGYGFMPIQAHNNETIYLKEITRNG